MKHITRFEIKGKTYISPGPNSFIKHEVIPDLETAKKEADRLSPQEHFHCYVVPVDGGYVVMGYSEHWLYFEEAPGDKVVYKVEV